MPAKLQQIRFNVYGLGHLCAVDVDLSSNFFSFLFLNQVSVFWSYESAKSPFTGGRSSQNARHRSTYHIPNGREMKKNNVTAVHP